ncbi:eukaryotic translation initiation factor 3 subunit C-like isoform X2 [Ylistrum balloti]|uniref:eukaryotic translation initiation factor 3 subunit C-like isoform X2 n=1 Tax=Ylistrum balloti TaxID=509963 RepID=UPI002905B891|nr:eukaryotic translation initiation factor 3 subunit C-like isoform X2 [Ylistrum balloti]
MAGRFFRGSDSESDSSSDSDEPTFAPQKDRPMRPAAFQLSDDEEEQTRVVRSAKDKRYEELRKIIKLIGNHKKIKDMSKVLSGFEDLGRAYDKAKKVVDKEGGSPRFYIRCLSELEDFVNECWEDREGRKQMSKNNAKGLTTLRQKLRKYNRDFEEQISSYKEHPDEGDEDDEEKVEEKEVDTEEIAPAPVVQDSVPAYQRQEGDDIDDDDLSDWSSSETDSSSSDDEMEVGPGGYTLAMFLKKKPGEEGPKKEGKKDRATKKESRPKWQPVKKPAYSAVKEKTVMFAKEADITHEAVVKKLAEIIAARGKKGTDRSEQIELLKELMTIADGKSLGPAISVKIMFHILAAIYDYNPNIATCMRTEMWEVCLTFIKKLLGVLVENRDITIGDNILEESEILDVSPYRVRGCILTLVERLDEEFTKMLQACDAHSTEYVDRLKDESIMCDILEQLQEYLEYRSAPGEPCRATSSELCRIYLRRVEHTYYKFDRTIFDEGFDGVDTSKILMGDLCKYIYAKDNTDRLRTRAMLCQIYHHALHDRWYEARDLMLMSHLQDNIHHSDVPTQILYNRTMVQLGLCAFRQGRTRDAHNALVDIQSGGRAKELLAQGLLLQRQHERTPEQEKIEKRRLLPYHMHINLEQLECVYLVSAMLMEIPYMAAHEMDARRRMISKNFHHVLRMSERQTLTGPPESMREHVVAASKAMKTGNWKECKNYIINEKMSTKVWDLFFKPLNVQEMITTKIQKESLRTYLFTYSSVYDSLSLVTLANMFELERSVVHSIISKMILNEELMASLDEPTQTVVMHRTEPTRLQSLALQLSEKVSSLVDNNERIMDLKQGNLFFGKQNQQFGYQNNNQNQGGWQGKGPQKRYEGGGDNKGWQNKNRYNDGENKNWQNKNRYNDNRGGENKPGWKQYGGYNNQNQNSWEGRRNQRQQQRY